MHTSRRDVQDTLAGVLHRLALLERAVELAEPRKPAHSVVTEIRRINDELERTSLQVKDAAALHQAAQQAAETAERRSRLLFLHSPTPCLVLERSGAVVDANPAAVRMLNMSVRHLVGRSFEVFVGAERQVFLARLQAPGSGDAPASWPVTIRPRERGSRRVVCATIPDGEDRVLLMLLPPETEPASSAAAEEPRGGDSPASAGNGSRAAARLA